MLADFIFEAGGLKRLPRSGWLTIGISDCESVAEHSFRSALIGLALARLEEADEEKVVKLCLLHDVHEARVGDIHAVAKKYLKSEAERAARDALHGIPLKEAFPLWKEFSHGKTAEARIARDADLLEMIATAKEYVDAGNRRARAWIENAEKRLSTPSAKRLARELKRRDSLAWLFRAKK